MTNPCRSDCPAGDCAGCVFPWPKTTARCVPTRCPQSDRCHRAAIAPGGDVVEIDATCAQVAGEPCPMFIDRRGAALLGVA